MDQHEARYGKQSPGAAPELARFAFLIGAYRCDARLKLDDGTWEAFEATWVGRYVLDGYAIVEEYRMTRVTGEVLVLGMNVRSYDVNKQVWTMKWLNALDGTWVDLGPEELGGVAIDEQSISYVLKEPVAAHALTRATYLDISESHFTWRGERSFDGESWEEFLVVEANRTN